MNIGIIFAGGVGERMNTKALPKQFLKIYGKPIIIYTLEHFEECKDIDSIIISCVKEWIPHLENLLDSFGIKKVRKIVPGGETGQLSIYNALLEAEQIGKDISDNIVLIHDGVRPLINSELLTRAVNCVKEYDSAITTSLMTETLVVSEENGAITEVPSRNRSRVAKAPQCFYLKDIMEAHKNAIRDNIHTFIDSCTMMQHYGFKLQILDDSSKNIKITTIEDFFAMRAMLEMQENSQIYIDKG